MLVGEILERKRYLSNKLWCVNKYLNNIIDLSNDNKSSEYSKILDYKFKLLNKIRSYDILLNNLNNNTNIDIDDVSLSVSDSLLLLRVLKDKLDTYEQIIVNDKSCTIDIFDLLDKNDDIFEKYMTVKTLISISDFNVVWDGK